MRTSTKYFLYVHLFFLYPPMYSQDVQHSTEVPSPIFDETESQDIDFSFFNDPYAFNTFKELPIKAKFSGYLEYTAWWTSRQAEGDGDVFEILFPKRPIFDADCQDINAQGECNMTVMDTRLRAEFFGPHVLGAHTFGFIESDAFGQNLTKVRFRLWHAFLQLSWQHSKILLGQFWHPFSVVNTFPPTVSIENGSPVTPNSRNPQIRYTVSQGNKKLLLALVSQSTFASDGPIGHNALYLRNARVPILVARAVYDNAQHIYAGIGILFQRLKPRIESDTGYHVKESINSAQATLFATLKFASLEIRQQLTFAQNANNLNLLGGFGVTHIEPVTDMRHYANTNTLSYWADININKQIEPGLFIGIVKNFGARTPITPCIQNLQTQEEVSTLYGLGMDINTVFKCYPRIRLHMLPFDFALEVEITRATYGCINDFAKVKNREPTTNIRALFASYYYF